MKSLLQNVIESIFDPVAVLDLDGRMMLMNRRGLTAFEVGDFAAFERRPCDTLWPRPAAAQIRQAIGAAAQGESHRFEGMCPTTRGEDKWWDVFSSPLYGADGAVAAIMVTSRDITALHQQRQDAEARARELDRAAGELRSAFQIALVGGWEVDFVGERTLFSAELCTLLGAPPLPPMLIPDSIDVWFEDDRADFRRSLERVRTHGERLNFEGRTIGPDGEMSWWRLFGEPVMENGVCIALRGAAQDVTGWRTLEERERVAIQATDAMSGFLATMSHELRTPLNGVLGMAQAMARGELSPSQRDKLGVIETSGEVLLSLLNDLLDLAKIQAGKIELEDGVIDVEALTASAHSIFTALVRDKKVTFDFVVDPSAEGYWRGDPTRVRQVLYNLISNAVKFTEAGSITVNLAREHEDLTVRVEDTGVGIASDRLARVFERFVQADATTTRRHGGTGLGLTICRDLVGLMGGDIGVESVEGVGTTFTVRLPLPSIDGAPDGEHENDVPDSAELPSELRELAAEDNAVNQLVLTTLLAEVGIEVVVVSNGQDALDAWRDGEWDIVLTDIQMPVMDGVTAVQAIREIEAREGRRRTPVVALTANAMAHQEAEYLAAGMDAIVAKPINLGMLLQTMGELLASPAERDASIAA